MSEPWKLPEYGDTCLHEKKSVGKDQIDTAIAPLALELERLRIRTCPRGTCERPEDNKDSIHLVVHGKAEPIAELFVQVIHRYSQRDKVYRRPIGYSGPGDLQDGRLFFRFFIEDLPDLTDCFQKYNIHRDEGTPGTFPWPLP